MITGTKRTEKEYRKLEILSASDLKTFATEDRRVFFKKCILKEKEEESSRSAKIGSAAHCLLLEPLEFDNKFFMSICSEPPTGNMKKFVDSLFKHTILNTDDQGVVNIDFKDMAPLAYAEAGFKRDKIETVLLNFKNKEPEMFYKELRACGISGKELICIEDRNIAEKVVETVKYHEYTKSIFTEDSLKEVQIEGFEFNELALKAMIDNIDIVDNTITVTDLKVTWTNEDFFKEYFLKRRADIQAFVYLRAVAHQYPGYKINPFRFVVADSTNFNSPIVYEVSHEWYSKTFHGFTYNDKYYKGLKQITEEIKWHQKTGNWTTSKEVFNNNGLLKI